MPAPDSQYRTVPNDGVLATNTNTPAKRLGAITGQVIRSTGVGNEVPFGSVDITGGAGDSTLWHLLWNVTNAQGNVTVDNMRFWLATNGFDDALTVARFRALSGTDETTPTNTENIKQLNPNTISDYTYADMVEADPGSGSPNLFDPAEDDNTSIDITTPGTTDDAPMWTMYIHVGASESLGTFKGLDAGFENRFNMKYEYV